MFCNSHCRDHSPRLAVFLGILLLFFGNCEWDHLPDLALSWAWLLLVYRNDSDFYTLILYPEALLKLFIRSRSFWAETMGFSRYKVILSANMEESLTFTYPGCLYLFFLPDCPG